MSASPSGSAPAALWRNPHILLFLGSLLWGLTWPAAKTVAEHLPPVSSAGWRFSLALLPLLFLVYRRNGGWPRLSLPQYGWLLLCGTVGVFGYMVCFMWGLALAPAGRGSLVLAFNPVLTGLGAALFLREPIGRRKMLGMALAVVGALLVITHGDIPRFLQGGVGRGELILLGCAGFWSAYGLMSKRSMAFTDSMTATTYPMIFGTALLLLTSGWIDANLVGYGPMPDWGQVPHGVWWVLLFLALGGTVLAYTWYFFGVSQLGPTVAATYNTLVPVFGVLFAWLLLGEATDWSLLLGGAVTVLGLSILNSAAKRAAAAA